MGFTFYFLYTDTPTQTSTAGRERGFLPITLFTGHTHPHRHAQPDSRQEEEGPLVTSRSSAKKNAGRRRVSKDTLGW